MFVFGTQRESLGYYCFCQEKTKDFRCKSGQKTRMDRNLYTYRGKVLMSINNILQNNQQTATTIVVCIHL